MSRRGVLAGGAALGMTRLAGGLLAGVGVLTGCGGSAGSPRSAARTPDPAGAGGTPAPPGPGVRRLTYGPDLSQFGDLLVPPGAGPFPVAVILHGGFWRAAYDLTLGAPLAADLLGRGYATFNLEYRRVGSGGGWPATAYDVAAGIDLLAGVSAPLDLDRVVTIGHSAGGQLAAWAASRPGQPAGAPGAAPAVTVRACVSQAGVLDLVSGAAAGLGGSAVSDFLGGTAQAVPDRYALASPVARLPWTGPVLCVHGRADTIVPPGQSSEFVRAATAAGTPAELVLVDGDHFVLIDPTSPAWGVVVDRLPRLLG